MGIMDIEYNSETGLPEPYLCQACVCIPFETEMSLSLLLQEKPEVEQSVQVCEPCHRRINRAIDKDEPLHFSVIGNRILGIRTPMHLKL